MPRRLPWERLPGYKAYAEAQRRGEAHRDARSARQQARFLNAEDILSRTYVLGPGQEPNGQLFVISAVGGDDIMEAFRIGSEKQYKDYPTFIRGIGEIATDRIFPDRPE